MGSCENGNFLTISELERILKFFYKKKDGKSATINSLADSVMTLRIKDVINWYI
jgi:hypothetical protein